MADFTRREFLCLGTKLALLMGLGDAAVPRIASALAQIADASVPALWLQGQSCSGCSVSLLNSTDPGPAEIVTQYISLLYHSNLSAATGDVGMKIINDSVARGGYILVVEGSLPAGMPKACMVGHEPVTRQVLRAAKKAKAIVAAGTCASFGGIPGAENNPTGAVGVSDFLRGRGVSAPVINIPGCPMHPDWFVGTLVHVLEFGLPKLDDKGRPVMFFGGLVHDQCPRFADYEREHFATSFSDEGCLFKLGCLGPNTHADCTLRQWNSGCNYCIRAGAPCIGCTWEKFALKADLPFYRKAEQAGRKEQRG